MARKGAAPKTPMPAGESRMTRARAKAATTAAQDQAVANGDDESKANLAPASPKKRYLSITESDEDVSAVKKTKASRPTTPEQDDKPVQDFPSPPDHPATDLDRDTWQGFCNIESDSDNFTVMLREMGVQGVAVREVFNLDPELLEEVASVFYGIVLLLRHRSIDADKQEKDCPTDVWFANQMPSQNSCATLAMFNILMNAPQVNLGEHLQQFKVFTANFTPYARGEALDSFQFVKKIHNSFATKMDMLQDDYHLSVKVREAEKKAKMSRKSANSKGKGKAKAKRCDYEDSEEEATTDEQSLEDSAHHFVVFIPVGNKVYKLDGMDAQPTCIGEVDEEDNWLDVVGLKVLTIAAEAGDNDYNVMGLVQSPLEAARQKVARNFTTASRIKSRLDSITTSWGQFAPTPNEPITPSFLQNFGISKDDILAAEIGEDVEEAIEDDDMQELLLRRETLIGEQHKLVEEIMTANNEEEREDNRAKERRWDYAPVIKKWLEMLAFNGHLEQNLDRFK